MTSSAVILCPHLLHFQAADSSLGASERIHASASSHAWETVHQMSDISVRCISQMSDVICLSDKKISNNCIQIPHIRYRLLAPGRELLRCKIQAQWQWHRCIEHKRSQNTFYRKVIIVIRVGIGNWYWFWWKTGGLYWHNRTQNTFFLRGDYWYWCLYWC